MKYLILLLLLAGCSKSSVSPSDITGNWQFSSTRVSGDFSIAKVGTDYKTTAGSTFTIDGVSYTAVDTSIPSVANGSTVITLQTAIVSGQAHGITFNAQIAPDWKSMKATNVRINTNTPITDTFTVNRK